MIRVGVFGAGGRMGTTVCAAVVSDSDLELVAGIDPAHAGEAVEGVTIVGDPGAIAPDDLDVVVDFTRVDAARGNVLWAAENGVHAVVGTSGFEPDDHERFRAAFARSN